MSSKYPIIAVTGSSGAGTTTAAEIFEKIFSEEKIDAAIVHGDSFHKYTREQMAKLAAKGQHGEKNHFSLNANHIDKLEALFQDYGTTGTGQYRHYVHDDSDELVRAGFLPGTFTPWASLPGNSDLLFYEGLHGGVVTDKFNIVQHVDLLIGMAPIVNLEWIQKIYRDTRFRGYSEDAVVNTIIKRMEDYVRHIVPQFSNTDINFQRVPLVDTSNPFVMRDVPTDAESMVLIRFKHFRDVNFPYLLQMLPGSFVSRHDTLVIPGHKMSLAVDLILRPMVLDILQNKAFI